MRWFTLTFVAGVLVITLSAPRIKAEQEKSAEVAPESPVFTKDIRPLLKTYCFECHSPTKRRGGLDLEKIEEDAVALDLVDLWNQVGERLTGHEMPPSKNKQPTEGERQLLSSWVQHVARSQVSCEDLTREQARNR